MSHIPLNRIKPSGKIDLWDMGPQIAPKAPTAPVPPDATKLKGAELAAAELEHEDALETYKGELRAYSAARRAHREWGEINGGPVKVELWGVDARHAMETEPDRFKLDLPKGSRPGRAQLAADELAKEETEEIKRARARDPQFGAGAQP